MLKIKGSMNNLPGHGKNVNELHKCLCCWHVTFASYWLYIEFAKACLYKVCMYIAQLKGKLFSSGMEFSVSQLLL